MTQLERHQYMIRFGYFGAPFYGLQPQKDVPTAGATLRTFLERASGGIRATALCFSARTDRGVHAIHNSATFYFRDINFDKESFEKNVDTQEVDEGLFQIELFPAHKHIHARGSSRGKRYKYIVDSSYPAQTQQDLEGLQQHDFSWRIAPQLSAENLKKASNYLMGTHDFSCFRSRGCNAATPIKTLYKLEIRGPYPMNDENGQSFERFFIEIVGTAFLRRMIRNMVAALLEIGTGLRPPSYMQEILDSQSNQSFDLVAPPGGLTLMEVGFDWPADGSNLVAELRKLEEMGIDTKPPPIDPKTLSQVPKKKRKRSRAKDHTLNMQLNLLDNKKEEETQ